MGTSNAYGGPGGGSPLVPTWLDGDGADQGTGPGVPPDGTALPEAPAAPKSPLTPPPTTDRFTAARGNFTRFAGSGGNDRASLGRAISQYVSKSSGGARQAAQRMGSSRRVGAGLIGFLSDVQARGAREALRALNLERLAGRPIVEVFLGLVDYICPAGGTIDEGISRGAFIETIADLANLGIADLDALTVDQMQTMFELYATHAIEGRICNDIGMNVVTLPADVRAAERVQEQLHDFIRRGVSDALEGARAAFQALTPERVLGFVSGVYQAAFEVLQILGHAEATI